LKPDSIKSRLRVAFVHLTTDECVDSGHEFVVETFVIPTRISRPLLWPPCLADADISLYIRPVVSSFFLFSPSIPSRRRLNVYHTATHDVALVRIYNAGLSCVARGSLKIQDVKIVKNSSSGTIAQISRARPISSQLRHISTIAKSLLNSIMSSTCPHSNGKLRPTNG